MKKFLTLILLVSIAVLTFAQSNLQDVVYLKNGSVIRGIIIEQVPNKSIKIETNDRNIFVYQIEEVEKMTKEPVQGKNNSTVNNFNSNTEYEGEIEKGPKFGIGIYGSPIFPFSPINDFYKMGGGFGAKIYLSSENSAKKTSKFGITLGYSTMKAKDYESVALNIMPIAFFSENCFGTGKIKGVWGYELGGYNLKTSGTMSGYDISDSEMKFGAGFYLGLVAGLTEQLSITSDVKYNYAIYFDDFSNSPSWLSLNIGLTYTFGTL